MGAGAGYPLIMGVGLENNTEFGTNPVNATTVVPVLDSAVSEQIQQLLDNSLVGKAGHGVLDLGGVSLTKALKAEMQYTQNSSSEYCGVDDLLLATMGAQAYNSDINIFKLAESPDFPFTLAWDMQISVWELVSAYSSGFTIELSPSDVMMVAFDLIAFKLLRTGDAGIENTAAELAGLGARGGKRVLHTDITVRLGDLSNALGTDSDEIGISTGKLVFNNNLSGPTFTTPDNRQTPARTLANSKYTIKPERNGRREATMQLKLERYEDQWAPVLEGWKTSKTPLQLDIKTSIDSGARSLSILCPHVRVVDFDVPVPGAGLFAGTLDLRLLRGEPSGNSYMKTAESSPADIDEEFVIEIKNSADGRGATISVPS